MKYRIEKTGPGEGDEIIIRCSDITDDVRRVIDLLEGNSGKLTGSRGEGSASKVVIDKKKVRLKDAGLPDMVMEKTPKLMRLSKVPVVKAKVGPQIMTFICDAAIFDQVPVKKEVKATVSGLYLTGVKGLHGNQINAAPAKKKNFFSRQIEKLQEKAGAKPV